MGEEIWTGFLAWAGAKGTQYWASWVIILATIGAALRLGSPYYNRVTAELERAALVKDPDGRIKRVDTKLKRIRSSWSALLSAGHGAFFSLLLIVGLPLCALISLTLAAEWFFGAPSLIDSTGQAVSGTENLGELVLYFTDQLSKGLLFDAMEVFGWNLSSLSANPANTLYLSTVFVFRFLIDIYVAGLVVLLARAVLGVAINSLRLLNPMDLLR